MNAGLSTEKNTTVDVFLYYAVSVIAVFRLTENNLTRRLTAPVAEGRPVR